MRHLFAAAISFAILLSWPAQAHFDPVQSVDPLWADWASRQWSKRGGHCCTWSHARLFSGRYEYNRRGDGFLESITIYFDDGQVVDIPGDRLVDVKPGDPNPTGTSVLWYDQIDEIYCFAAPGPLV